MEISTTELILSLLVYIKSRTLKFFPVFDDMINQNPQAKKEITKTHCQYTMLNVGLLCNIDYGISLGKDGYNKGIETFRQQVANDLAIFNGRMLYSLRSFAPNQPGHAFSVILEEGLFYVIDSWYTMSAERIILDDPKISELYEYINDYQANLEWKSIPLPNNETVGKNFVEILKQC
jgi:hypothetical protein